MLLPLLPFVGNLDPSMVMLVLSILALLLFALGVPIFLAFGVWVIGFHYFVPAFGITNVPIGAYELIQSFPFAAIPLFLLTGDLIYEMGEARRLVGFAESIVGWVPGSIGNTSIIACGIFSAITGSNVATTASVGKAMHPELVRKGYKSEFASATVAAGGVLGGIIPPSVIMIIYGTLFNVSVSDLFLAGLIPGLMMLGVLIGVNTATMYRSNVDLEQEFEFEAGTVLSTMWDAKIGIGAIVVLLGGIFSGTFTPTEAAAVAIAYILLLGFVTGNLDAETLVRAGRSSLLIVGIIVPIIVMSVLIQQNLSFLGVLEALSKFIIGLGADWAIILAITVVLLLSGAFLNSIPNVVLMAPILAPAAFALGLSPLEWGIVFLISDQIGFITPPYGLNLYVISGISGDDYIKVAYSALPYLALLIVVFLLLLVFPEINFLAPS